MRLGRLEGTGAQQTVGGKGGRKGRPYKLAILWSKKYLKHAGPVFEFCLKLKGRSAFSKRTCRPHL